MRIVADDDHLILISDKGKIIRLRVKDIPTQGRATQGVRVMRLDDGESVAAIERLADPSDESIEEGAPIEAADDGDTVPMDAGELERPHQRRGGGIGDLRDPRDVVVVRHRAAQLADQPRHQLDVIELVDDDVVEARRVWTNGAFTEYASAAAFANLTTALLECGAPVDLTAVAADDVVGRERGQVERAPRQVVDAGAAAAQAALAPAAQPVEREHRPGGRLGHGRPRRHAATSGSVEVALAATWSMRAGRVPRS